jgi:nitrite reductase (NADH) large subunit
MKKLKLVMVGNGMAGVRTLEELLKIAPELYDITVFGAEPHPNYNRILLSPVLAGEQTIEQIVLNPLSWYAEHGITLHLGKTVATIDRIKRRVVAEDGTEAAYDRLLIATGSNPFILPVPGKDLAGVIAYRDIADTQAMIDDGQDAHARRRHRGRPARPGSRQRPDAARHAGHRGARDALLMERQLDDTAGQLLQQSLAQRGLRFEIGCAHRCTAGQRGGSCGACSSRTAARSRPTWW